jgi:hypothetical protein
MWIDVVVPRLPGVDFLSSIFERKKDVLIEALVTNSRIERFDNLVGLSYLCKLQLNSMTIGPVKYGPRLKLRLIFIFFEQLNLT